MNYIKHVKVKTDQWGWINPDACPCHDTYAHYLFMAAPQIKWVYVETVGDYQGTVYAIGKYKRQWFVMKDYYGSCSGCGAWGEGGQPENLKSVLGNGELFSHKKDALKFIKQSWANKDAYEKPTDDFMKILEAKK